MVRNAIFDYTQKMKTLTLHSKLIELQGQFISPVEGETIFSQLRKILDLRQAGQITVAEAGTRIRKAAWRIAEDLHMNDLALGSGTDQSLLENLPVLLKA